MAGREIANRGLEGHLTGNCLPVNLIRFPITIVVHIVANDFCLIGVHIGVFIVTIDGAYHPSPSKSPFGSVFSPLIHPHRRSPLRCFPDWSRQSRANRCFSGSNVGCILESNSKKSFASSKLSPPPLLNSSSSAPPGSTGRCLSTLTAHDAPQRPKAAMMKRCGVRSPDFAQRLSPAFPPSCPPICDKYITVSTFSGRSSDLVSFLSQYKVYTMTTCRIATSRNKNSAVIRVYTEGQYFGTE